MSFLSLTTIIQSEKAEKETIEAQLTNNSLDIRLKQKTSSNEADMINTQCNEEVAQIRNEMAQMDDKTCDEYKELMNEIEELKDERDRKLSKIESEATDYETIKDTENQTLQSRLEAVSADIESYEEARQGNIEDSFGYFQ